MTNPAAQHVTKRRERMRHGLVVYSRRMLGAMLCWTALQAAALEWEDGRARAEAQLHAEGRN